MALSTPSRPAATVRASTSSRASTSTAARSRSARSAIAGGTSQTAAP